jgi:hypothetical protein
MWGKRIKKIAIVTIEGQLQQMNSFSNIFLTEALVKEVSDFYIETKK